MALGDRLVRQMVEDDRRVGQIVEQRLQPLVEERQPVLHAGEAAAFADRGVERVVARRRAERLDVVAAEAADRLRRQRHLAHRLQRDRVALCRWCAASRRRRRGWFPACRRRNRAAAAPRAPGAKRSRMPPRTANSPTSRTVGTRSKPDFSSRAISVVHVDLAARPGAEGLRLDHLGRRHALQQRVGGGQDDGAVRRLAQRDHGRQRVEPARGGVGAGRDAVIGQAVPGRQFEHRQVGRHEGERLDDGRQALAVARHEQRPARPAPSRPRRDASAKASKPSATPSTMNWPVRPLGRPILSRRLMNSVLQVAPGGHDLASTSGVSNAAGVGLVAGHP